MTDLTPVGLSEDGNSLILVSRRGVEFTVLVDQRLRAALRGDHTRLGQLEKSMESTLRPRDIQARIRAGASVEEVAAAAGTPVEKLMVFARPVIAEREHIASLARNASVRRRTNQRPAPARALNEAAALHLRTLNVIPEDVAWDSWRREDGRWTVTAEYIAHHQLTRAVFAYDAQGRYVTAENEEAEFLTGERTAQTPPEADQPTTRGQANDEPAATQFSPSKPNSSIVLGRAAPSNVPLGDDAIELVRRPQPVSSPAHSDPEVSHGSESEPAAEHASRKKARASMPSWDEIMFGNKDD